MISFTSATIKMTMLDLIIFMSAHFLLVCKAGELLCLIVSCDVVSLLFLLGSSACSDVSLELIIFFLFRGLLDLCCTLSSFLDIFCLFHIIIKRDSSMVKLVGLEKKVCLWRGTLLQDISLPLNRGGLWRLG